MKYTEIYRDDNKGRWFTRHHEGLGNDGHYVIRETGFSADTPALEVLTATSAFYPGIVRFINRGEVTK